MTPPAGNVTIGEKHNFSWQQTMLRIKDPKVTVPFYERHFGMKLVRPSAAARQHTPANPYLQFKCDKDKKKLQRQGTVC